MKRLFILTILIVFNTTVTAQERRLFSLGFNAGVPIGQVSEITTHTLGIQGKIRFFQKNNISCGFTSGYTRFFEKNGAEGFGQIYGAPYLRYVPDEKGIMGGLDFGFAGFVGVSGLYEENGLYLSPSIGYKYETFNFLLLYSTVTSKKTKNNYSTIGLGIEYNF
jgi:hypothetical protein